MQQIRYLDKLVDELAKGRALEKVLRTWRRSGPRDDAVANRVVSGFIAYGSGRSG